MLKDIKKIEENNVGAPNQDAIPLLAKWLSSQFLLVCHIGHKSPNAEFRISHLKAIKKRLANQDPNKQDGPNQSEYTKHCNYFAKGSPPNAVETHSSKSLYEHVYGMFIWCM